MLERRPALGRGLSALIPDVPEPRRAGALEVDIDLIDAALAKMKKNSLKYPAALNQGKIHKR